LLEVFSVRQASTVRGFTLIELLVVVAIAAILAGIAVPGWVSFERRQRLNLAQQEVLGAMRESQRQAIQHRRKWQTSFRELEGRVQWASHPVERLPAEADWHFLPHHVKLDGETTLRRSRGVHQVQFDHFGNVNGQLGRLTLAAEGGGSAKRCVVVSTLLGTLRNGTERAQLEDGKSCW
jgi:prepilin-type N-terminal cleavage/methylation domain-containing protein